MRVTTILIALAGLGLAACGSSNPKLMKFPAPKTGPDEFLVVPAKPLQTPPDATLPPPAPGYANRADATPRQDAVAALGGNPAALNSGTTAGEAGMVTYASRYGRDGSIRQTLAVEDAEYRRRNQGRLLERIAGQDVYYDAYERQSLDQQAEIDRFRDANVPTPSAPPAELKPE
ncbi:DUF3035 domain-containing protein [Qingshengfaniella alkalisoli]|uniref:DUF3035 domain-containing protein n=1 Tax=Qingshengfaniella alkalisoli TaxID=2599296 RepID=A0A5B8J676_9RHOB|nr:DUF3035 domain-containing protein [Qingshengfaniella alkalisoli]QDY69937.1 DUF3035 domain-containing protein [Qingshengfaniella alkalisoli]